MLDGIFWLGWVVLVASTFLLNHFELFGLSQVFATIVRQTTVRREIPQPRCFTGKSATRSISGSCSPSWATPSMTVGHLLFAGRRSPAYILIGIQLEERDLVEQFGDQYRRYRQRASMLVPLPGRKFVDAKEADL